MKKQILTLTMCLALTATAALAEGIKTVPQQASPQVKVISVTPQATLSKPTETKGTMTRGCAKKHFEEKMAKERALMYCDLGFSAEQKVKAEALDAKNKAAVDPLIRNVHAEMKKFRDLKSKKVSGLKILEQKHKVKMAKKEVEKHFAESKKSFEAILTKEQKAKFELIDAKRKKEIDKFKKNCKHRKHKMNCNCNEPQKDGIYIPDKK